MIVVEPGNPHDFNDEELRELVMLLEAGESDLDVRVATRQERGYGVTPTEVLHIFVDNEEQIVTAATALATLYEWLKKRATRDKRRRVVVVYGPDGRPLKEVRIEGTSGDLREDVPGDAAARQRPA